MTGFDETAPDAGEHPEHDSNTPAVEDEPTPDEPPMGGDDDLVAGHLDEVRDDD